MYCQNCGAQVLDKAVVCVKCGALLGNARFNAIVQNDNSVIQMIVPVGRSGWAIAAGYAGIFSLIPFVGIIAILLGLVALNDIKKHPDRLGKGRAWFGVIMGAGCLLVHLLCLLCTAI